MKKVLGIIVLGLITGICFSLLIFKKYESMQALKEVEKVYFIQQGVYSNYNNMVKNTEKLEAYTYEKIDGKYYVYVCFTTNKENINIIEEYFKSLNYSIYAKEKELIDVRFMNVLTEYDYLLSNIKKKETTKNICKQLVKKYEEYK